jgi:hypothetical protein
LHRLLLLSRSRSIKCNVLSHFWFATFLYFLTRPAFPFWHSYYFASDARLFHWSLNWLIDGGFSFLIYSVILVSVAVLWRPAEGTRAYAFALLPSDENEAQEEEFGLDSDPSHGDNAFVDEEASGGIELRETHYGLVLSIFLRLFLSSFSS